MNNHNLHTLLSKGEGQRVEFKSSLAQTKKGIQSLAAMANSNKSGGHIIFGVDDNGKQVKGFALAKNSQEKLANTIKSNVVSFRTSAPMVCHINYYKSLNVLVVSVSKREYAEGPYIAYGRLYERIGRSTHLIKEDPRSLILTFKQNAKDIGSTDPLGYRHCPDCGNKELHRGHYPVIRNFSSDLVACNDCGWKVYASQFGF